MPSRRKSRSSFHAASPACRICDTAGRRPHPHEHTRQKHMVFVLEQGAQRQRASRRVDLRRDIVEMSFVRIALLTLQADLDRDARNAGQVRRADRVPRLGVASPERQNLRLARREIDIERVGLDDDCERGWGAGHTDSTPTSTR